ncbi:MAG: oxygen-independent coproporphyrinogen III oxidase [Lachnospiraceae bacterium]|nr:oxygen-independent coproporphyrinogen III oxidase [Lachnospiraceae bacterium]
MRELSLYVHIPFCMQKCRYCDFLSYKASEQDKKEYVELLLKEIEQQAPFYAEHQVISVFFGGGTPSVLDEKVIEKILCKLKKSFSFVANPEITIEVNPGTVTEEKLQIYFAAGINRLSIGLQSANDEELRCLGRIHDYQTFLETYELARKSGFRNINIDLMSAIPGQSEQSYRETLSKVLALQPEHISAYSLILEEGTWFFDHQKELDFPTEDEDRILYELTGQMLSDKGYHRYEISNYAREGYECLHNKVYWKRGDYLGLGLGAASMVEEVRFSNKDTMEEYREMIDNCAGKQNSRTCFRENIEYLTREEQMEEFMFLGLRLTQGVSRQEFEHKFGVNIEEIYGEVLTKLQQEGLLLTDEYIRLTPYGMDISNYVMSQFLLN